VAGSYGGISFMVLAVLFILVEVALLAWPCSTYLWHDFRHEAIAPGRQALMTACGVVALGLSGLTFALPMRRGVRALESMSE
jgi:hypothetical protein